MDMELRKVLLATTRSGARGRSERSRPAMFVDQLDAVAGREHGGLRARCIPCGFGRCARRRALADTVHLWAFRRCKGVERGFHECTQLRIGRRPIWADLW